MIASADYDSAKRLTKQRGGDLTVKKFATQIGSAIKASVSKDEVNAILDELVADGVLTYTDGGKHDPAGYDYADPISKEFATIAKSGSITAVREWCEAHSDNVRAAKWLVDNDIE